MHRCFQSLMRKTLGASMWRLACMCQGTDCGGVREHRRRRYRLMYSSAGSVEASAITVSEGELSNPPTAPAPVTCAVLLSMPPPQLG